MVKKLLAVGLTVLAAVVILFGVVAYSYLKPAEAASGPIQTTAIAQTAAGSTTYTIQQSSSEASFTIDEVLNGSPKSVVGTTDQVSGEIALDLSDTSTAQVGTIQINARTLTTDSDQRNNAIKNMILDTNDNEYITFAPTSVVGLPTSVTVGQSYTFQMVGQLTVAGQAHEATFDVTVTATDASTLQGSATTTIAYADWGISVPNVPVVTGVADTTTLAFDFVATAK
jgi:polyisoprenoid-binding protein YceI